MQKLILNIDITGGEYLKTPAGDVGMVFFGGSCGGELFTGNILGGGVDTQHFSSEKSTLSARYMLEGTDFAGQKCRIFIENNAVIGEERTYPSVLTDSEALSWLNTEPLSGRMINGGEGLTVEIARAKDMEENI